MDLYCPPVRFHGVVFNLASGRFPKTAHMLSKTTLTLCLNAYVYI
jgi:hypothetical protein